VKGAIRKLLVINLILYAQAYQKKVFIDATFFDEKCCVLNKVTILRYTVTGTAQVRYDFMHGTTYVYQRLALGRYSHKIDIK